MKSWTALELRYLDAFRAVAAERSFGKAASRLGYSQSAVSQQIAALERIVGERLFVRPGGPAPVSLTEVGDILLVHVDRVASQLQSARADITAVVEGRRGAVRVGVYQSVGARLLPSVIREVRTHVPAIEITLRESPDDRELAALVEAGDLDVAFVVLPLDDDAATHIQTLHLFDDPFVVVGATGALGFSRGHTLTLSELTSLPLIDYRYAPDAVRIEALLATRGFKARIVFRSDHNATIQALAAANLGVAVVPRLTVDTRGGDVQIFGVEGIPPRRVGIAWHKTRNRSVAARRFVASAASVCRQWDRTQPRSPARSSTGRGDACSQQSRAVPVDSVT